LLEWFDGLVKGAAVRLIFETILTAWIPGSRVCVVRFDTDIVSKIQSPRIFAVNLPTLVSWGFVKIKLTMKDRKTLEAVDMLSSSW